MLELAVPDQLPEPQQPQPPKVSVVVVSHNRAALLRRCLESLERSDARAAMEIIVVDNGSTDGAAALENDFPAARFFRLPKNFGFTKALNIGVRSSEGEYVFFLHDDAEAPPECVRELAAALEASPDAAAACPLLVDEAGHPAPQLGSLPPEDDWRPAEVSGAEPVAVTYPKGAAVMYRVFFLKALRHIDERYGQFGPDADLAAKILRASKKILLLPAVKVRHQGREQDSPLRHADFLLGRAVYLGKYHGFGAGLAGRLASVFRPLAGMRFGELAHTFTGQKIDGTQA